MANVNEEGFVSVIENETGDALVSEVLGIPLLYNGSAGTSLVDGTIFGTKLLEGRTGFGGLIDGTILGTKLFEGRIGFGKVT